MTKNIVKLISVFALVSALCFAQTALTTTTLSTAVATPADTQITLAAGTGITVQGAANAINTVLYVDRELMRVVSLVSGTTYVVQRGQGGTRPFVHAAGAKVWLGSPAGNFMRGTPGAGEMWGSCYAPNEVSLPKIFIDTGDIFDCKRTGAAGTAGQWVLIGHGAQSGAGQAVSSFCTGTAGSAETEYLNDAACSGATTATKKIVVGNIGTVANLYVYSSAGAAAAGSTITVMKNGSDTAMTCAFTSAAVACSDVLHQFSVVPGDVIAVKYVSATSESAANVSATMTIY